MKIKRKIMDLLKTKDMGLWNPCYFMNLRDACLIWEERKALLYLFEQIVSEADPGTNINSGVQFDLDTPGEVEYFALNYRPQGHNEDDWDDWGTIYIFNYYTCTNAKHYVEELSKKHGAHWGSFKAGLRGWYDYILLAGLTERKPTNYKPVAV